MMEARDRDVARVARDQHHLGMSIGRRLEADFAGTSHRVAGMREQNARRFGGSASQHREFEQAPLIDPEPPLVEPSEHRPDEGPSRFWIGDDDRIGFAQPGGIAKVALQSERRRTGDKPKRLRRGTPQNGRQ
jgi:hypothetical protein